MSTRKVAKKATKKASARKAAGSKETAAISRQRMTATQIIAAILRRREWVMYGVPIRNLIATGNLADMRRVSTATRTHLADVQRSIAKLDAAIRAKSK